MELQKSTVPLRIIDMCSGTGCIGVAIAKNVPLATVLAVDMLPDAVACSNENAARNGVSSRYLCVQSDMFEALVGAGTNAETTRLIQERFGPLDGTFDVIVSNPPYILPDEYEDLPDNIKHWESKLALIGDEKRADRQFVYFQELVENAPRFLIPNDREDRNAPSLPSLLMEVGIQGRSVAEILEQYPGWSDVCLVQDFADKERVVSGVYRKPVVNLRSTAKSATNMISSLFERVKRK